VIRATVDANVLISHLLKPAADGPPNRVVKAAIAQVFELVIVETTLLEMRDSIQAKPYLNERITSENTTQLESALRLSARVIPESIDNVPRLTRDPGDDYLLAHAILHDIAYLVSGDRDLLELGAFEGVRIVSPAAFAALLDQLG
jgi:putative PIN family toxin of toxin-antitoxin system